jgi:prepilin-type N-terminal cleavage/methylation domain-containing protein
MIALHIKPTVNNKPSATQRASLGFSLVELTIVLVIVALLSTGLIFGISAQRSVAENADAQRQLESIREALLGYAMANGRLPCPATPDLVNTDNLAGKEDRANKDSPCNRTFGVLPWVKLGLPETDPWGNRYTYFASSKFTGSLTPDAQASFTLTTGSPDTTPADNAGTANVKDIGTSASNIASDLPAVVVSHGGRAAGAWQTNGSQLPGASGDELENSNATQTFVSRTSSDTFDDQVIWIAQSTLKSRMVAAGRLP